MSFTKEKINEAPALNVKGGLTENAPLGAQSWFRCGGAADLLFQPADNEDLAEALKQWPDEEPLTIIGGLANTIIRDGGLRGLTIQLGKPFAAIEKTDETFLKAGAGALNGSVAAAAMKAGLSGLEFLSGIPGSLGGALAMNAGAYGTEMKDVLVEAEFMLRDGTIQTVTPAALNMTYRHTKIPQGAIFISATLRGQPSSYEAVKSKMNEIKTARGETQPIREKTGGSTFANPSAEELAKAGLAEGTRAWQIVEKLGGRGLKIGGAMMSEQHCNFMINTGDATAQDLESLGDELIRRASEQLGLKLRWEIKRIGEV